MSTTIDVQHIGLAVCRLTPLLPPPNCSLMNRISSVKSKQTPRILQQVTIIKLSIRIWSDGSLNSVSKLVNLADIRLQIFWESILSAQMESLLLSSEGSYRVVSEKFDNCAAKQVTVAIIIVRDMLMRRHFHSIFYCIGGQSGISVTNYIELVCF